MATQLRVKMDEFQSIFQDTYGAGLCVSPAVPSAKLALAVHAPHCSSICSLHGTLSISCRAHGNLYSSVDLKACDVCRRAGA